MNLFFRISAFSCHVGPKEFHSVCIVQRKERIIWRVSFGFFFLVFFLLVLLIFFLWHLIVCSVYLVSCVLFSWIGFSRLAVVCANVKWSNVFIRVREISRVRKSPKYLAESIEVDQNAESVFLQESWAFPMRRQIYTWGRDSRHSRQSNISRKFIFGRSETLKLRSKQNQENKKLNPKLKWW